jgi:predicted phosphoribosyltransferase
MRTDPPNHPLFHDHDDASTRLARRLPLATVADPVVIGIARGGAVIAAAVVSHCRAGSALGVVFMLGSWLREPVGFHNSV